LRYVTRSWSRTLRRGLGSAAVLVFLSACGGDEGALPLDPGPHEGTDEIVFSVYRTDEAGQERLAWLGTVDGPLPDSPESTPVPWVGFLQPFRVDWRADSARAPIVGTRIRPSNVASAAFLAIDPFGDGIWGAGTSFRFANAIPPAELVGADCPTGPDCPDRARFAAGPCSLRVLAINRDGELLDARLGRLHYQVNFRPQAEWAVDGTEPDAMPYWAAGGVDGRVVRGSITPGDTIPAGVRVHLRLRGRDRFHGSVDPDSACCDRRLDDMIPVVRHQARTYVEQRMSSSLLEYRQTIFGALSPDSSLSLLVGPFDYRLDGRVADEHGTRSAEVGYTFVAGLRPGHPRMSPAHTEEFEFLPPHEPIPTDASGPRYELVAAQRRWRVLAQDWTTDGEGELHSGHFYRLPLTMQADPHPRVREISPNSAPGLTDHVRAFAYELIGEFDPFNRRINGRSDLITNFLASEVVGALDLVGDEGYQVFVPVVFWTNPEYFAPEVIGEAECLDPGLATFCDMGRRIREDLGRFRYRAVARTTNWRFTLDVLPPLAADSSGTDVRIDLDRFGRRSEIAEQEFSVRLVVPVQGLPEPVRWPQSP
jgi:hypothetical protein